MIKKQREKQYAVFGLGRFGTSVALTLNELGYQVMGVDTDEDNVQRLAHELTHVVTADSSDERTRVLWALRILMWQSWRSGIWKRIC